MSMAPVVGALLAAVTLGITVPVLVLFVQLMTAVFRLRSGPPRTPGAATAGSPVGRLAVLMPAHDEAEGILGPIRSVLAQFGPGDRLLVVADNCTDATAEVARAAGAEVVERNDPGRRGKGYALDFGVRWLERDPPDVVVIVDADCRVGPQALQRLATTCVASGGPVQALYLMRAPPGARVGQRIAEFAWLVKNRLRPAGYAAWGFPCPLMGTGMAFPWRIICRAPLATGHLVEDMQLGLDLAIAGTPPLFCEEAGVESMFPTDAGGAKSQRTRWEHGHLSVIASVAPRMLVTALRRRNGRLLAMVLDLCIPPLASLVLALAAVTAVDAVGWFGGAGAAATGIAAVAWGMLFAGVLGAWFREGRKVVSVTDLLALPFYVFGKIPVYVRLFTKRQVDWVRTRRDDRNHP